MSKINYLFVAVLFFAAAFNGVAEAIAVDDQSDPIVLADDVTTVNQVHIISEGSVHSIVVQYK